MIVLLLIIIFILSVILHELTHHLVFRFQGVNVVSLKVFFLSITKGKIHLNLNLTPFGYVIPSTQKCSNEINLSILLKIIRDNMIITSLIQVLQIIICLLVLMFFHTSLIITNIVVIFIIVNTLMLLGSIDNSRGDLSLVKKYQKNDLNGLYAILCTSQLFEEFQNGLIYSFLKSNWKASNSFHEYDNIVLNYIIEYEFRVKSKITDEMCSFLRNQIKLNNRNALYLYYKSLIYWSALNGQFDCVYEDFYFKLYKQDKQIINAINKLIELVKNKKKIQACDLVLYCNINESKSYIERRKEYLANVINVVLGGQK